MIAYLQGKILSKDDDRLIVLTNGIGYQVTVSISAWTKTKVGETISLYTHFHVREDAQTLFGFLSKDQLLFFKRIIQVNGVGPRLAMALLDSLAISQLVSAVQGDDHAMLTQVPGIGTKKAKRLLLELKTVFEKFDLTMYSGEASHPDHHRADIIQALEALGYRQDEVINVMSQIDLRDLSTEQAIKQILQLFSK